MPFAGLNTCAHGGTHMCTHRTHASTHTNPINSLKEKHAQFPCTSAQGLGVYVNQCTECVMKLPGFGPQHCIKTDVVAHTCNPSTREVEAGGWQVEGHPQLQSVHGHAGIHERFWQ